MELIEIKKLFGRRVRYLRKLRDLTQEELAELSDVSTEFISKIERGLGSPSFKKIIDLANSLEVETKDLFDFSDLKKL